MSKAIAPVWDTYPFSVVDGALVIGHPSTPESATLTPNGVTFADGRAYPWSKIMGVNLLLTARGARGAASARFQDVVGMLSGIVMVAGNGDDGRDHLACVTLSREPAPWFVFPPRPKLSRRHRKYAERFGDQLNDREKRQQVLADPAAAVDALGLQIRGDQK